MDGEHSNMIRGKIQAATITPHSWL